MRTRYLAAICLALSFLASALAQSGNGFPTLPPVPKTGQLVDNPACTQFIFISAGDNRPATPNDPQPPTLLRILQDATRFKPAFMLWSGDTIAGFRIKGQPINTAKLTAQYEEFFSIASKAGVPIFNSPGNHEMDSRDKTKSGTVETPDAEMQKLYLKVMQYPANAPAYGAFNYGNSRFIAVDTEEPPTSSTLRSPGKIVANNLKLDPGYVSPKQITLLANDLEANKHKAHIFVFMHHPINPAKKSSRLNKESADELEALFAKYPNVSFVIAAHEHLYYYANGSTLNPASRTSPSSGGPVYLVSGGAGAPLDSCPDPSSKNCSATHHYLVFEVNGNTVSAQVITVSSDTRKKS